METILVLTHVDETGSALTKASLEAVTAGVELARQLSATLTIGILGPLPWKPRTPRPVLLPQPARVCLRSLVRPLRSRATPPTPRAARHLCRAAQASIVLAPGSSRFARVAAGVAHRLGGFLDTHITSLSSNDTRGGDALVLSPARGGGHQPRRAPVVPAAGRGDSCGVCGRAGRRAG